MSRKYKFHDKKGLYLVSFATVYWMDVFVRDHYLMEVAASLDFCRREKGMELYAWCIMPSHVHLILRSKEGDPGGLLGSMKKHTSKEIQALVADNPAERNGCCG